MQRRRVAVEEPRGHEVLPVRKGGRALRAPAPGAQRLQAALNEQQHNFNMASVGRRTTVLIERAGKLAGQMLGKSPWLQSVHVIDPTLTIGDLVEVDLTAAGPNSLTGTAPMKLAA